MSAGAAIEGEPGDDRHAAERALSANPHWYHTIELAPGVVTPGYVDWRGDAARVLPADLSGRRALDVGTYDGFWALEMERRGAATVAIDVEKLEAAEWPPINRPALEAQTRELDLVLGRGFRLAAEILSSRVRRVECDVYDLTPEAIGGRVDFAFSGAILIHLRDPARALERILGALEPGGTLVVLEPFAVPETLLRPRRPVAQFNVLGSRFTWWRPNVAALRAWLVAAGFEHLRRIGFFHPPGRPEMRTRYCALSARRPAAGGRDGPA